MRLIKEFILKGRRDIKPVPTLTIYIIDKFIL